MALALARAIKDDSHTLYSKHRLEALSDGIFAIVMTLLILDIKVPTGVPHGQLAYALAQPFRDWIALVMTFVLAARFWVLQHQLFDLLEHIKPRTLGTTFTFLGLVSMLPFTTALWGHNIREPLAFCVYFAHQFLIAVAMLIEIEFGLRDHNLHVVEAMFRLRGRLYVMVLAMAAAAIAAWFLPLKYTGLIVAAVAALARRVLGVFDERRAKRMSQARVTAHG